MAIKITTPDQFSSVQKPMMFVIDRDESTNMDININGYLKEMGGTSINVDASMYFRGDIRVVPIPEHSETLKIMNKVVLVDLGRITEAGIYVMGGDGSVVSDVILAVDSLVDIKPNRFLTDLKKRYYEQGQMDELSAASISDGNVLSMVIQSRKPIIGSAEDDNQYNPSARYFLFSMRKDEESRHYAVLKNQKGVVLDYIEFIPLNHCTDVRLCWINRYGALDYWNFTTVQSKSLKTSKTKIYTSNGYLTTEITAEDSTIIRTEHLDSDTCKALADILLSQSVWIIGDKNTYTPIDIVTSNHAVFNYSELGYIQLEYRPKMRIL